MKLLIEQKAAINAVNSEKETPLHLAAFRGKTGVVKLLLEHQAEINSLDWEKKTPLNRAEEGQHRDTINLLIQHKAQRSEITSGTGTSTFGNKFGAWDTLGYM